MSEKTIVRLERADRDTDEAIEFYLQNGGVKAASGFIDALENGFGHISRHPATGSQRYAHQLKVPGLRCWPMNKYPYLIFYFERERHIDVVRMLHSTKDIPATAQIPSEN